MRRQYYTVDDIRELWGCGESRAYGIIRQLNAELKEKGFIVIAGKVPRAYVSERFYGGISPDFDREVEQS